MKGKLFSFRLTQRLPDQQSLLIYATTANIRQEPPSSMGDRYDADEVLVSFALAWVCTIAYYADLIPGSRFVKVPFANCHIHSLRAPEDDIAEDEMKDFNDAQHKKLYSWLSTRASKELRGNEEKFVVLRLVEGDDDGADDESVHIAYVIEFARCDEYEQNEDMIRNRASHILKSIQVCCMTDDTLEEARLDLDVWKGPDRHRNIEALRKERMILQHGSFRVGYFEFRCWMVR